MKPLYFTVEGYEKIKKEHDELQEKRKEAVLDLKTAREMGDLSENAAYRAARWKLSSVDSRLRHLDKLLRYGKIIQSKASDIVCFGSTVTVEENGKQTKFIIVGKFEVDLAEGKISEESPIGKALIGKRVGDKVTITTPSGIIEYIIVKIK